MDDADVAVKFGKFVRKVLSLQGVAKGNQCLRRHAGVLSNLMERGE